MLKICAYLQIKPIQAEQKKAQTCKEIYEIKQITREASNKQQGKETSRVMHRYTKHKENNISVQTKNMCRNSIRKNKLTTVA
jgi:hypothetical protein